MDIGTNTIVERLKGSALWRQAESEAQANLADERRAAADRIAEAEAAFDKVAPRLKKNVAKADKHRDGAWDAWLKADAEFARAQRELADASDRVAKVRREARAFLIATSSERVDEFVAELERELADLRDRPTVTEGGRENRLWNRPSIEHRAAAILRALRGVDDLRCITDPADLEDAIESVRASLPVADEMVPLRGAA